MTIALAEQLIPWMDDRLLPKTIAPTSYEGIKANIVKATQDKTYKAQMKAFAQRFKGNTQQGQIYFLQQLYGFTKTHFPYERKGFSQEVIKPANVCFYQRSLGSACQNLNNWFCDILYHLPVKISVNVVTYKTETHGNIRFLDGHVYPSVELSGKRIILDATLDHFNEEVSPDLIENKEIIKCY